MLFLTVYLLLYASPKPLLCVNAQDVEKIIVRTTQSNKILQASR